MHSPYLAAIPVVSNFINGVAVPSSATKLIDVTNPATNEVIIRVPESTQHEMEEVRSFASLRSAPL